MPLLPPRRVAPSAVVGSLAALLPAACAPPRAAEAPVPRAAWTAVGLPRPTLDSTARVARGVVHRTLAWAEPRWRVDLLDLDLGCGATVSARKAGDGAVGRAGTRRLVEEAARTRRDVIGGVNADFFSFTPPGVPVAAHVEGGRLVAGPSARPVLALDGVGRPWIDTLAVRGRVALGAPGDTLAIGGWNRSGAATLALFDAGWGARTDSVPGRLFVTLGPANRPSAAAAARGPTRHVVVRVDSGAVTAVPADGALLVAGASVLPAVRLRLAALRPGTDTVAVAVALAPIAPREAVGGHPLLVRDGAPVPGADRTGAPGFHGPNPRTAVAVSRDGRRLLLLTVDGRRPGWSVGMSLAEETALLRALGAWQGLNLDGGGSTTFVVRDGAGAAGVPRFRIANQPSDSTGERPVANALVAHACPAR